MKRKPEQNIQDYDTELDFQRQRSEEIRSGLSRINIIAYLAGVLIILASMIMLAICCQPQPARADNIPLATKTIALEASGESLEAQSWVARVIQVRMQERGQSADQVVLSPYQFSCWIPGTTTPAAQRCRIHRTPAVVAQAREAWELARDIAARPNLYHDISVSPTWARSSRVKFLRQIGRLRFYREERG